LDPAPSTLACPAALEHGAQQIFQEAIDAIEDAIQRLRRLEQQLALIVPSWSMGPVVDAYQAMPGASFLVVVTFAAEIGDVRRFPWSFAQTRVAHPLGGSF
jgi:transposase